MFQVQMDEEEYRLVGPGEEAGLASEYGEPAVLRIDDAIYYALAEDAEDTPTVYKVASVDEVPSTIVPVEFDPDEQDEEEDTAAGPIVLPQR